MLKLVNITKEYKTEEESVLALRGVSIEFRKSEFVSILGPSGCGKTTLLNIVGGLDRYTDGDIQVDGVSTKKYRDEDWDTYRNRRIGFVFQSYNLIPHMTVLKNVQLSLTLAGVPKEEGRERALEALRKVGLEKQAKKKPNQMSGGQMQRVAIARALVNDPDIILADEPTGALDSESGVQVMELLKEVARDRLVVMVTHNGQLADEYSTRIINLKDGEVVGDTMPYDSAAESAAQASEMTENGVQTAENGVSAAETGNYAAYDENGMPYGDGEYYTDEAGDHAAYDENGAPYGDGAFYGENGMPYGDGTYYDENAAAAQQSAEQASPEPPKKKNIFARIGDKIRAFRKREKSYMSIGTAVNLSWTNLLSKKGRTLLTSIAGSIGIIGIVVVLALSNGVNGYISALEENALSQYPITINDRDVSLQNVMNTILGGSSGVGEQYPDSGELVVGDVLGSLFAELDEIFAENDLKTFKAYIEDNFDDSLGVVKYGYGTTLNIYTEDPKSPDENYMKVNPFTDAMGSFLPTEGDFAALTSMAEAFTASWDQISTNQELLERQYDVVAGRWPDQDSANEIIVVMDSYNTIPDFGMFMLGLRSQDDLVNLINSALDKNDEETQKLLEEFYKPIKLEGDGGLVGKKYYVITDADYFIEDESSSFGYTETDRGATDKETVDAVFEANGVQELEIVGVVRPKPGVTVTSINGYVGYTEALTLAMLEKAESHPIVEMMKEAALSMAADDEDKANGIVTADNFRGWVSPVALKQAVSVPGALFGDEKKVITVGTRLGRDDYAAYVAIMRAVGVADPASPQSISFYANSFDHKAEIEQFIQTYIDTTGNDLKYTDQLAIMMAFVEQLSSTVTQVLVGFAAISLIVSTIMIAIIIYTSVLERRKEIGVLRSLGARKKDIARVFISESAILGAYSGAIGIVVAVAFSFAGSAILAAVLGISGLMSVSWWQCLVMFAVSVALSILAGFIPSRIASKKDPTVALRSE